MSRSKFEKIIFVVLWNIALILIFFTTCELILRYHYNVPHTIVRAKYYKNLLGDFEPNMCWIDERVGLYPYKFTTNSQGIRSLHEISKRKTKRTIRILCLGDSFTMGWGVDDEKTYPELLYQSLKRKYPEFEFDVINAGNIFTNILDETDYFNKKGIKLLPNLVIVQFYTNDIYNEMTREYVNRIYYRTTINQYKNPILAFLHRNLEKLALYNFLAKRITLLENTSQTSSHRMNYNVLNLDKEENFLTSLLVHDFKRVDTASNFNDLLNENNLKVNAILWNNYLKGLIHIKEKLDKLKIPMLFIIIPSSLLMYKNLNAPLCFFNSSLQQMSIPYVDFTHIFRAYSKDNWEKFYLKGDGHTNPLGNTLLASVLAQTIRVEKDAHGSSRLSLHSDNFQKDCRDEHHFFIYQSGNNLKISNKDDLLKNFSIKTTNISTPNEQQKRNGYSFLENRAPAGAIELHFSFARDIENFDMLFTKNIYNDSSQNNGYTVSYSIGGGPLVYISDDQGTKLGGWTMEKRVIDIALPRPSQDLTVRFDFKNQAGLIFANSYSNDIQDFCTLNFYGVQPTSPAEKSPHPMSESTLASQIGPEQEP